MLSLFLMRYSFFGRSDWRSDASRAADLLFDSERLEKRARLLEQIALRSLSDQTDGDFDLIVLSSEGMPAAFRKQLSALCKDTLGDRVRVLFEAAAAQGLTLVSKSGANRSPFNIAHKKILERRPVRVIHGGPVMYLRSVERWSAKRTSAGSSRRIYRCWDNFATSLYCRKANLPDPTFTSRCCAPGRSASLSLPF